MPPEQPDYDFLDELLTRYGQIRIDLVKRLDARELDKELRPAALEIQRAMLPVEKLFTEAARRARRMLHTRISGGADAG
jgi:hypothetical protein